MTNEADGTPRLKPLVSVLRLDDIAPLLIAWQKTREAIGSVETSQPYQMSAAMNRLISAREDMEKSVNALLPLISR